MYRLVVFDNNGNVLFDFALNSKGEGAAKQEVSEFLAEKNLSMNAYRLFDNKGSLLEFNAHKYRLHN